MGHLSESWDGETDVNTTNKGREKSKPCFKCRLASFLVTIAYCLCATKDNTGTSFIHEPSQ